ncbi:hypothetical protein [Polynucleobacter sp. AP-Nino-20-G2]|uniref:hypothetical protein n=1 Tax=Polynucleobacter sp. AP-Nino-20-G2 TaxID=2576917 RepID=UPI001BFD2E0D|nr:hypothetical protein [Polynucleobacter sp. AP-Nino-20-G2]QWE17002.1 hypothetical protein FD960_01890 [Polynucleobacter sp. AP-Nino-20-G2]
MQTQNLLMAALTHLIQFQTTHCAIARERALMMFEALAELKESSPELQTLCCKASDLLIA